MQPSKNTYVVAITTNSIILERKIYHRVQEMFHRGVVDEAKKLAATYGWGAEAMTGNIYPILRQFIDGELSETEAMKRIAIRDRQLVKRQITWIKRRDYVHWLSIDEARKYLSSLLD